MSIVYLYISNITNETKLNHKHGSEIFLIWMLVYNVAITFSEENQSVERVAPQARNKYL